MWQIAAGDGGERAYQDILLKWDIVAVGPGEYGRWPENLDKFREERGDAQVRIIERFVSEVHVGDIVVLRLGKVQVYGVGIVESDYLWLDDMGDVDGWDLQHCRRVRWVWRYTPSKGPQTFPIDVLRWGDTVQKAASAELKNWLNELPCTTAMKRPLAQLPDTCVDGRPLKSVQLDEVSQFLYDRGVAADDIDALTSRMTDLVRIASWYRRAEVQPAERETVSYLVVPLLRSLGWTPQRMAIEWNRIDVALFDALPRIDSNLVAAVEAKKRNRTCFNSSTQAFGYASQAGRERCLRAVATEGLGYSVFQRKSGSGFERTPSAYLNLTRLVAEYPLLGCSGAQEALAVMAADWSSRNVKAAGVGI